ncbi:AraC family transcriptional regulator [Flavobacteriaceae bacterium S356]|uniref:AraC family transcriptional regulator n=1 Tax=Asprobacillus argus TaxID=3076534 RepID=A0ABU3LDD2_9FLAO|nr:AraC family transcriptional regulator [Flavobacteriaceae bacterium S356]
MSNTTQLERYKKLLSFIDDHFKEDINIGKIEDVSFYSYRNINRIFEALHNETIGKYIKRLRLEKAAQYLAYSDMGVSEIAYEVGFEDRAAFSKAFKSKYKTSPSYFRAHTEVILKNTQQSLLPNEGVAREQLKFEIEYLPSFEYLFLEYRGNFDDLERIHSSWDELVRYITKKGLLSESSIFMTEIVDDADISDTLSFRYHLSLVLEQPLSFAPEGLFRKKTHKRQKYVKFTYKGSDKSSIDFYKRIYAFWMLDVNLELVDLPTLEFYPNYEENLPEDELITEIYIPVA